MDEILVIQERNRRVELDKAWEMSWTRRGLIALVTYVVAMTFMYRIGVVDPWLNAFVPTGGYVLSTLSLGVIKKWWIRRRCGK